jgi:tetratricopeptide (TPR) repeat protein
MNMKPRSLIAVVCAFLVFGLAGCVSVEKRYKKGQELEAKGRLEEAAQRYITVLTKDPNMEEARRSLADVGARVVEENLARARADEADGLYENAVAAINRIDGLRGRAGQVGVSLAVPDDYADFRRGTVDAAVVSLFRQGEDLEEAGNWPDALRTYERMAPYPLTSEQRARVDGSRARILIEWAEQDMARGSFRAAYGHAQNALDIYGPEGEAGAGGRAIQKAALDAGTMTVAVLPFWTGPATGDRPPRGLEGSLYDTLLYEYMAAPVLFVGPIDRGEIHREMTRLRVRSGEIPARTAGTVGLALNADFVVVGWIGSYRQEDGAPQETARQAPLRGDRSKSAAYTERRYTVKLTGEVTYRIIEPASRRVVGEETVAADASAAFRRARYDGDPAALDLSRDERRLFDREEWRRAEEELQASLVKKLAERTAAGVFEKVLRFVK